MDEVGELPLSLQAKLLRAVETREIRRVGGIHSRRVDVRILSATNRDLAGAVTGGAFRRDLFTRLRQAEVLIPPLRDRREDIPLLAEYFLRRECGIRTLSLSKEALEQLQHYDWPGNVRELRNVLQVAVALVTGDEIRIEHLDGLCDRLEGSKETLALILAPPPDAGAEKTFMSARQAEAAHIQAALTRAQGVTAEAARLLGLPRSSLYRRMKILGIRADELHPKGPLRT